jgi:hypothetical protein
MPTIPVRQLPRRPLYPRKRKKGSVWASILFIAVVWWGLWMIGRSYPSFRTRGFNHLAGEYGRILDNAKDLPAGGAAMNRPARNGVIIVSMEGEIMGDMGRFQADYTISPWFLDLPAPLKPSSPSDVGTIVGTNCEWHQVGTYSDGTPGDKMQCDVVVVDVATDTKIAEQTIAGPNPPETKYTSEGERTVRPDAEFQVLSFIRSLPRFK